MDLLKELKKLISGLQTAKIDFALCGGLAMAIYAFPRATMDIDFLIKPEDLDLVKKIVHELGFSGDSGYLKFKQDAIQIYRLNKIDPESQEILTLDLLLATPEIQTVWDSRKTVVWEEGMLPVVSPDGLIQLKTLRGSGQDQDDIQHLRKWIDEN